MSEKNVVMQTRYHPFTASPFRKNNQYNELLPRQSLAQYVRCFWGSEPACTDMIQNRQGELVIPDTCVDIIYHIDYTENKVTGGFCGINDRSFYAVDNSVAGHVTATFAIRFYAWEAYVFAQDSFRSTANGFYEVGSRFAWLDRALRPNLLELQTLQEKVSFAERLLLEKLQNAKENQTVRYAVNTILIQKGSLDISKLAKASFVSSRQLERLFHEYVGITPKKLSNLIRYQLLWRDILYEPDFEVLNAVHQYGYTDQSHLLHAFKRFHSMDIRSAKRLAYENVANLQDILYGNIIN